MPEIKNQFTGGKMNKDVDERLVPKGEYRDAMNIQVSTSEGSDVGTIQNILGNSIVENSNIIPSGSICIGSISDEKNDSFYWLTTQDNFKSAFEGSNPDVYPLQAGNYQGQTTWPANLQEIAGEQQTILSCNFLTKNTKSGIYRLKEEKVEPVLIDDADQITTIWSGVENFTGLSQLAIAENSRDQNLGSPLVVGAGFLGQGLGYDISGDPIHEIYDGANINVGDTLEMWGYNPWTKKEQNFLANYHDIKVTGKKLIQTWFDVNGNIKEHYVITFSEAIYGFWWDQLLEKLFYSVGWTSGWSIPTSNIVTHFVFKSGILNFSPKNLVTGINIIDNLLFWTDNANEPKKINVDRSVKGTDPSGLIATTLVNEETGVTSKLEEKHITVIKKGPESTLGMDLKTSRDENKNYTGVVRICDTIQLLANNNNSDLWDQRSTSNPSLPYDFSTFSTEEGTNVVKFIIRTDISGNSNFELDGMLDSINNPTMVGTKVVLKEFINGVAPGIPITDYTIKGIVTEWIWLGNDVNEHDSSVGWGAKMAVKINSISRPPMAADPATGILDYAIDFFDETENLYEFKFPRFSYRYKYLDGEYSTFAPWTRVAFIPGGFDYHPKKGYNLGMTNNLSRVNLKGFSTNVPKDVVEIDILYKEEDSPSIYVVETLNANAEKTIEKPTGSGIPIMINEFQSNELEISEENIKSILPSNQFLRPWDNVPKKALAQDVTGSRIVYANYEQNYDLKSGNSKYIPSFKIALQASETGITSIKSLREYQLGVVFTDKYGRETPVVSNSSGSFKVEKAQSVNRNSLQVGIGKKDIPENMEYFKFYIKETSGEYYNMAMDRYWDAEDGNVWISFPSTDRNKIDIDSFLILKKGVDSDTGVDEPARFKVIAIENEAPDFIKTNKTIISSIIYDDSIDAQYMFHSGPNAPTEGKKDFLLKYHWGGGGPNGGGTSAVYANTSIKKLHEEKGQDGDIYFQITNGLGTSSIKPIRVAAIDLVNVDELDEGGEDFEEGADWKIQLEEPFDSTLNQFTNDILGINSDQITTQNRAVFWKYKVENSLEFDGRFFVKVFVDTTFTENIINNTLLNADQEFNTIYQQKIYSFDKIKHHGLAWKNPNSKGAILTGSTSYAASKSNQSTDPQWDDYIDITNWVSNNYGTGMSSTFDWKDEAAFLRGINIYKAQDTTPSYGQHGINKRKGFGTLDYHDSDASNWDFEDVWFIDNNTLQGQFGSKWGKSRSTTDISQNGTTTSSINLAFGGLQPKSQPQADFAWNTKWDGSNGYNVYDEDNTVYDLNSNAYYQDDNEGSGLANRLVPGTYFRWKEDPLQNVYQITSQNSRNAIRYEQMGNNTNLANDMLDGARGYPNVNSDFTVGLVKYQTSTFYRPENFSKNYNLQFENVTNQGAGLAWDPFSGGSNVLITNGLKLTLVTAVQMLANSNQMTLVSTIGTGTVAGNSVGLRGLEVGMVYEAASGNKAMVSKIDGNTIYFKNHLANVACNLSLVAVNTNVTFRQYSMNGYSVNSAKNINWFNNSSGYANSASKMGVDAIGYTLEIIEPAVSEAKFPRFPAIWETEPKKSTDLDIYYEISQNIPTRINANSVSRFFPYTSVSPYNIPTQPSFVVLADDSSVGSGGLLEVNVVANIADFPTNYENAGITNPAEIVVDFMGPLNIVDGDKVFVTLEDGTKLYFEILKYNPSITFNSLQYSSFEFKPEIYKNSFNLAWHNCYSFGNGVESNRVRDNYNLTYINQGVKASSTLSNDYKKERRRHGLIFSGLYNSVSGVNDLNQFIQAEKITKDLNPTYGSIQKLHSRDSDLIALCEDKILRILANKDAVFNADGNAQLTANERVLGQTIPFVGEYGISKNPESFASESYRAYFTDKVRGAVLRLSKDGLTSISNHGMKDYFRDKLKENDTIIGSYDDKKDEYNVTLSDTVKTVSFKENVKGWVSFKSFVPENAISCANEYYTIKQGRPWKHHVELFDSIGRETNRNTFYGIHNSSTNSTFTTVLNDSPSVVKSFKTINYEGSQSRINQFVTDASTGLTDGEYYNLTPKNGWYVDSIKTDKESGSVHEFIEKEGKWFNYIKGRDIVLQGSNVDITASGSSFDQSSFAIQGLGRLPAAPVPTSVPGCTDATATNYNPNATTDDGSCIIGPLQVFGCTDPNASNYNAAVNTDDLSCVWFGCTDPLAFNYDASQFVGASSYPTYPGNMANQGCIAVTLGCTDNTASNYNPLANTDDGSCIIIITGCSASTASNYDSLVNNDDGSCTWYGCTNPLDSNYVYFPLSTNYPAVPGAGVIDDGSCIDGGCTDATASNFNPLALWDDGSCQLCDFTTGSSGYSGVPFTSLILNTSAPSLANGQVAITPNLQAPYLPHTYELLDASGNVVSNSPIAGQTLNGVNAPSSFLFANLAAGTYVLQLTSSNGVCVEAFVNIPIVVNSTPQQLGCTNDLACNFDFYVDASHADDGSCEFTTCSGCTDPTATNFGLQNNSSATPLPPCTVGGTGVSGPCTISCGDSSDNTSFGNYCCDYPVFPGCTDSTALNYNSLATVDDGSCITAVPGCTDPTATNYDPSANVNNGTCNYPVPPTGCIDPAACNYDPQAFFQGTAGSHDGCFYKHQSVTVGSTDPNYNNGLTGPVYYQPGVFNPLLLNTSKKIKHYVLGPIWPLTSNAQRDMGLSMTKTYGTIPPYNATGNYTTTKSRIYLYKKSDPTDPLSPWSLVHQFTNIQAVNFSPNGIYGERQYTGTAQSATGTIPYPFGGNQTDPNNYEFDVYYNSTEKNQYKIEQYFSLNSGGSTQVYGYGNGALNGDGTTCGSSYQFEIAEASCADHVGAVIGCTDTNACNYDLNATCDDGSCYYATAQYFTPDPTGINPCYACEVPGSGCTPAAPNCPTLPNGNLDFWSQNNNPNGNIFTYEADCNSTSGAN